MKNRFLERAKKVKERADDLAQKHRKLRACLLVLLFVVILYFILTSSFFCTGVYLPIIRRVSGCEIYAREAKIRMFRPGKQFEIKDLKVNDGHGFTMDVKRVYSNLSFLRLFQGKIKFYDVEIQEPKVHFDKLKSLSEGPSETKVSEPKDTPSEQGGLLPSWLVFENIDVKNMDFHYIGEQNYNTLQCHFATLDINTLSPKSGEDITCDYTSNFSLNSTDRNRVSFNIKGNLKTSFDESATLQKFCGHMDLTNPDLNADDDDDGMAKLSFVCDFTCRPSSLKNNTFSLEQLKITQKLNGTPVGELNLHGDYNTKTDFFVGNATSSTSNIQAIMSLLQLKNDFNASSFDGKINAILYKNKNIFDLDIHSDAKMKNLCDGAIKIVDDGNFSSQFSMQYDLSKKKFTLSQFHADAFDVHGAQKKNVLTARISKPLHLELNKSTQSYSFLDNDSEISIQTADFPVAFANIIFPVRFSNGRLESHFSLRADSKDKKILGKLNAYVSDTELSPYNGKQIIQKHDFAFSATIGSDSLSNFRELSLSNTHLSFLPANSRKGNANNDFSKDTKIFADLSGKYLFMDQTLSLRGELITHPCSPDGLFYHWFPESIKKKIKMDKADDDEFKCHINTTFDFHKRTIDFSGFSTLQLSFLPGMKDERNPLTFSFSGQQGIRKKQQFFKLNECSLSLPQHLLVKLTGKANLTVDTPMFSDGIFADLKIGTLSAPFVRSVVSFLESDDDTLNEIMEKLHYHNVSAKTEFAFYPLLCKIELKNSNFNFIYQEKSSIHIYTDEPIVYSLLTRKFAPSTGHAELKKLDLKFINMFVRRRTGFLFESIPMDGRIDLVFKNGIENVDFKASFDAKDFAYKKFDTRVFFGNAKMDLKGTFHDYFSYMTYQDSRADLYQQGEKCLAMDAVGKVLFVFPFDADIKFIFKDVNALEVQNFNSMLTDNFNFKKFNGDGYFSFKCFDDINILEYDLSVNVNEMLLQSFSSKILNLPELKGNIRWSVVYNDRVNTIDVRDASTHLQQKNDGKCVFDAKFTGRLSKNTNEMPNSELKSNGVDWLYWSCALKPSKKDSGSEKKATAEKKTTSPIFSILEHTKRTIELPKKFLPDSIVKKTEEFVDETKQKLPSKLTENTKNVAELPKTVLTRDSGETASLLDKATHAAEKTKEMLPSMLQRKEKTHYVWPFTTEFSPFEFNNNRTKVKLDIKNWSYTDYFNGAITGTMVVKDNIFSMGKINAKINRADITIDSSISVNQQAGWGINFYALISNLDISPFVMAFGEGNEDIKKSITGTFSKAEFYLRTTGVTAEKLDKNLKFDSRIEMNSFSIPLYSQGGTKIVTYMIYPITVFSNAIDCLTDSSSLRKNIMTKFSDSYDVLTGTKNVEFERGQIMLHSDDKKCTDIHIDKCMLIGPTMKIRFGRKSVFNPVHNSIDADTNTVFCGLPYYVKLHGYLDDPQVQNFNSVVDELTEYSKHFAKRAIDFITLGNITRAEWSFEDFSSMPPLNAQSVNDKK